MVSEHRLRQHAPRVAVGICAAMLMALSTGHAAAQESAGPSSAADATSDPLLAIDGASVDEVRAQQRRLKAEQATAERRLRDAETVSESAGEKLKVAETKRAHAQDLADFWSEAARKAIVDAYVDGNHNSDLSYILADDVFEQSRRTAYYEYEADRRYDVLKERQRSEANLVVAVERQSRIAADAEEARQEAARSLGSLDDALERQAVLIQSVEDRYERALAESQALEAGAFDETAAELLSGEQALHDDVVGESTTAAAGSATGESTRSLVPLPTKLVPKAPTPPRPTVPKPSTPKAPPEPVAAPAPVIPSVATVWIQGIEVAPSIAAPLNSMLRAASAEGLRISGSGFRDPQRQIQLRMAHCGASRFAIYEMRASDCSPPTAVPGRSMHERGLALDLTCSGVLIRSRDNPCYRWLAANASRHGLYNLPSEPWHWSTNGN